MGVDANIDCEFGIARTGKGERHWIGLGSTHWSEGGDSPKKNNKTVMGED
jgi:hypothetical protein